MNRLYSVIVLLAVSVSALFGQESDLFSHKRINLFDINAMPGAKGIEHKDSIVNNRIWRADQPRLYEYRPGAEENRGVAMIVIPGGGFIKQAYETAGVSFAKWLNTCGITAFVLLHRLSNQPDIEDPSVTPVIDAQRAVKWVRAHAEEYGIDPDKIGVIGCSAGGHISALANVVKEDFSKCGDSLDNVNHRPNFAILVSPVAKIEVLGDGQKTWGAAQPMVERFPVDTLIDGNTAPMLMIHASNDRTVNPLNSVEIYKALLNNGVKKSSLHVFPLGAHSIALRDQPGSTAYWPAIAEAWIREIGILPTPSAQ